MKNTINSSQNLIDRLQSPNLPQSQLEIASQIILLTNCRASEALSARWADFIPGRLLLLPAKKKSSNVILHDRQLLRAISKLPRLHDELIFPSINYWHLYHHFKNNYSHLFKKFKGKKNFKVTHGQRYANVEQFGNDEKIRDILHHRSTKSGKYYKLKKGVT
jgi:integrase